jgi:hypothetical protein
MLGAYGTWAAALVKDNPASLSFRRPEWNNYPGPHKFDVEMQTTAFDWFDRWLQINPTIGAK